MLSLLNPVLVGLGAHHCPSPVLFTVVVHIPRYFHLLPFHEPSFTLAGSHTVQGTSVLIFCSVEHVCLSSSTAPCMQKKSQNSCEFSASGLCNDSTSQSNVDLCYVDHETAVLQMFVL